MALGAVGGYSNYAKGILASSAELIKRHLISKDPWTSTASSTACR